MLVQIHLYVSTINAHLDAGIPLDTNIANISDTNKAFGGTPRWFARTVTVSDLIANPTMRDFHAGNAIALPAHIPREAEAWWRAVITIPQLDGVVFQPCYTFRPSDGTVCPRGTDFLVALRVMGRTA